MKQLASLFLALLTLTATAQINYPYNPDENADAFISTPDLMEFLVVFGYEWEQEEIQVDSIPLSMYLSSLEAMIEASALPEGTMPGQFLQWDGDSWHLVIPKDGCTLPEACNYDPTAHVLDEDKCILQDECGVCDGPGAIYDCGCSDIPEGDCDCEGNVLDALGACGGTCEADEDGDGICDDGDSCVGEADECGVCNGPGAIYGCGCSDIPEGACDCAGNVEDILGVCGGGCTADEDGDGICDDVDDCVGEYDGCGVCNGPGPVLGCGCNDIPEGYCDCNGNVLDAVGTCGGACQNDINGDGICDDDSIPGCTYDIACNYDPSASINDGSCDFTSCYGCTDIEACNYSPEATIETGICWYSVDYYGCDFACLNDADGDGVCDELEIYGCTDLEACDFEPGATELDNSCTYPGCNDDAACNFDSAAGCNDGSCVYDGTPGCMDPEACNFNENAICEDGTCTYEGCTNPLASNYDDMAGCDDDSCIVYGCMVDLACNYEPTANVEDESCEFGTCPGCTDPNDCFFNPTSTNDEACGCWEYTFTGAPEFFVVPQDVYTIEVQLLGAQGGSGFDTLFNAGGKGGFVTGLLTVQPNDTLYIFVGGEGEDLTWNESAGGSPGGWNGGGDAFHGGGGGGGASDIRLSPMLSDRIVVAGGGGGGAQGPGGFGGGLIGGQGSTDSGNGIWATGGTQTEGGFGGLYTNGGCNGDGDFGGDGQFGIGGDGDNTGFGCWGGAGGGGGWYGGGGMHINGAGGGSSLISNLTDGVTIPGVNEGNGFVRLSLPLD
jgi:hypothetical protein